MKQVKLLILAIIAIFVMAGNAMALNNQFGRDITISDLIYSTSNDWYGDHEDQETEPGTVTAQKWDLEGFFLNGTILTMIGGYDFQNNDEYEYGDIFIDITGNAEYGPSNDATGTKNTVVQNTFGYDYVMDLDFANLTYTVYELTDSSTNAVYYSINQESNPWRYNSGGTYVTSGTIDYRTGLTDAEVGGLLGGTHNVVTGLDLSFLDDAINNIIVHNTMRCGNDNLMGQSTPEPATMLLLTSGVIGLAGLRRKFFKKS
jgi:hypothetical protein